MKKWIATLLVVMMCLGLMACGGNGEKAETGGDSPAAGAEGGSDSGMTEEEAWAAAEAGTLDSDPKTGYEYSEEMGQWYYSNYPNYKDFNADGKIKVAFICKFSGAWFTPKQEALKAVCDEKGYEYLYIDANSDEQAWLDGVQNVINQDFDVAVLCPVNTALLPDAIAMLQEAGMAYMTTDDPGSDSYGFYAPHYGLDDYVLHKGLGEHVAQKIEEKNFMDGVAEDYSNFLFVLQDSPSVEAIHNRNKGFYDAIMEAYPDIPEDRVLWLDCAESLDDVILEKFSSTLQANIDSVDKWIVSGGAATTVPTVTLFREANVDMKNVIIADCYSMPSQVETAGQADVKDSCYGVGLVSRPSGTGIGNVIADLVENGTPFPAFTGYELLVVDADNNEEIYNTYFK